LKNSLIGDKEQELRCLKELREKLQPLFAVREELNNSRSFEKCRSEISKLWQQSGIEEKFEEGLLDPGTFLISVSGSSFSLFFSILYLFSHFCIIKLF
jgi:hypothetical protein